MSAVLEDAKELVIDEWGTLNTAASPQKLPEAHSPNHQNVWVDEKPGSVVTANGYVKLGTLPSNLPPTFMLNYFKTSDGSSQFIVSDGVTIYYTKDFVTFTTITTGLSPFFQLRGVVVRDKAWLTNGVNAVMTWDGATLTSLNGTGSTPNVPKGKYIATHDERVFLYGIEGELSAARFSSLADASGTEIAPDHASAWPTDNEIQISEGDADVGTGLFVFRGYLYCAKQYSIWRITGYDEYTYARVKTRASTGTRFQESVQIKDNLVHFIGVDGLYVFDGEEAKRISDIIDPASTEEGVFAFRNLQQPLLNNDFWTVSDTADFNAGTLPNVISSASDRLTLVPADDTQSDFNSGTLSNLTADDNPGNLQLAVLDAATSYIITTGLTGTLPGTFNGTSVSVIGSENSLVDQSTGAVCGYRSNPVFSGVTAVTIQVNLSSARVVNKVRLSGLQLAAAVNPAFNDFIYVDVDATGTGTWVNVATGGPGVSPGNYGPTDTDISFTKQSIRGVRVRILFSGTFGSGATITLNEMYLFNAGYSSSGQFTSAAIDYGQAPLSFGNLAATITLNGETAQFFTQSSDDGSTWDSAVNVSNGAAITSTLRRYLRWGVTLSSSTGVSTPVVDKVFVGGTYISVVHNTGGNINQWMPFNSGQNKSGQTITTYFRAAATAGDVALESWTAIVSGAIPPLALTDVYVQFLAFLTTTDATQVPYIESVTFNWIVGTGTGVNTLQNVASIVILNRYWLSAATLGASENDIVVVLGKSTFNSPWHKKDFKLLSFCRFQDFYIGGSSEDGSLYRLEEGFSKDGAAMDSFYETRDISDDDFILKGRELLVALDKSGPYSVNLGWSTDGGISYTEKAIDVTRISGESLSFTKRLNIGFMADSVRFRVRINAADQPFSVDAIRCFYRPSPQRGSLAA